MAWLNFQQAYRVIESTLQERLQAAVSLSWAEYELLCRLRWAGDRQLQMSEIADQLLASPSGSTRIADRLDRDGLITRETPASNRRVVTLHLTPQGRKVLTAADRVFREVLTESVSKHLNVVDLESFRAILRKLLEGNGAWHTARCDPGAAARSAAERRAT